MAKLIQKKANGFWLINNCLELKSYTMKKKLLKLNLFRWKKLHY